MKGILISVMRGIELISYKDLQRHGVRRTRTDQVLATDLLVSRGHFGSLGTEPRRVRRSSGCLKAPSRGFHLGCHERR